MRLICLLFYGRFHKAAVLYPQYPLSYPLMTQSQKTRKNGSNEPFLRFRTEFKSNCLSFPKITKKGA